VTQRPEETRCPQCAKPLHVLKTSSRPVTTLIEGKGVLKEVQLHCPEHKGTVYRAKTALIITPARSPYAWDLRTDAGLQRFGDHRQIAEIRRNFLERIGTAIPERTLSHLCTDFVEHWVAVHIESLEALRGVLEAQEGCVLHLDATGENGSRPMFTVKEGLSGMTLWACRVPSENRRDLATVLRFVKRTFGKVLAAVRDMGEGVAWAAGDVLEGAYILVCHFHFLRAVGNRLLDKPYVSFQRRLKRTGVKGALRKLLAALRRKGDKGPSERRVEELVRHILAYEKAGEGLGAPFDLLDLVFYERCVEAEPKLREWILESAKENRHDAWACRAEDALRKLHPTPALRGQREGPREAQGTAAVVRWRKEGAQVPQRPRAAEHARDVQRARAGEGGEGGDQVPGEAWQGRGGDHGWRARQGAEADPAGHQGALHREQGAPPRAQRRDWHGGEGQDREAPADEQPDREGLPGDAQSLQAHPRERESGGQDAE